MSQLFAEKTDAFTARAEITPDRMKIFLDLEPGRGAAFRREDLLAVLQKHIKGVEFDPGVIEDIVRQGNQGRKAEQRRIAKGREPEDGANGKLVLLVRKYTGQGEMHIDEKGIAHFAEVRLFDNVRAGQAVARLYAPKPGVDGKDVFGKPVRAKAGKPLRVTLEKGLEFKAGEGGAYQTVAAQQSGLLTEDHGRLAICEVLEIKGDIDYRCGNIDFIGAVKIRGDVLPGFSVRARTGIEIEGAVRGASLICAEGEIGIKGFIYGGRDSRVVGGRGLSAAGADQAHVETAGDIVFAKEALGSRLRTQTAIFLDQGTLAGGEALSVKGLQAKRLGNEVGLKTVIALCSDVEAGTEYTELSVRRRSYERALTMLRLHLGPYADDERLVRGLKPDHQRKISQMLDKLRQVQRGICDLERQRRDLLKHARLTAKPLVNFTAVMHPGVEVRAGEQVYKPEQTLNGPGSLEFNAESGEFILGALQDLPRAEGDGAEKKKKGAGRNGR